jgi:chaperonin GroEL (HSP60 family)
MCASCATTHLPTTANNATQGSVSNMWDEKVVQPLLVTSSAVTLATECVRMILKVRERVCVCVCVSCAGG